MGAAVASADPGDTSSSGSSSSSGPSNGGSAPAASTSSSTSSSPSTGTTGHDAAPPSLDKAIRDTIRAFTDGLTAGLNPQHRKSAQTADDEAAEQAAEDDAEVTDGTAGESPVVATTPADGNGTVVPVGSTDTAPSATATPSAQPSADTSNAESPATKAPVAVTNSAATTDTPAADEPAAAPAEPTLATLLQPATVAITSATNFVVAVGDTVISLPALLASLPTSSTPVADVITYLQAGLTSMGGSLIPLASLPTDVANAVLSLSAHLPDSVSTPLVSAGPATGYLPGNAVDMPTAPAAPVTTAGDLSPRNPVTFATRGGFAAPPAVTPSTPPALAPPAAAPESHSNTPLLVTGALAALLLSVSLWALFAAALPGLGGLADLMPVGRTDCIEISALHCQILEAKGHTVQRADFMAVPQEPLFDRIVMNPPFSEGRAKAHTAHAFGMLKPGGVLVAVLPSGMRNSEFLAGADMEWSPVLENQFDGTTVDVVLLRATPLELT
mgnify:CR=1 FL=1